MLPGFRDTVIHADGMLSLLPDARPLGPERLAIGERECAASMIVRGTI